MKAQSVLFGEEARKDIAIVYSPLNGTGYVPVTRALKELGYTHLTLVEEQRLPDGHFPTCPYPNPEIREAMALGIAYAGRCGADLLLATDPDCDRVGVAVRDPSGGYALLSGNETGMLLLDYLCAQRAKHGRMPADPVMIKTIVTTDMAERIAAHYGVKTINVLTGFKFIGEQIGRLEAQGRRDSFVFGFEESYGYLSGPYVRDKDGVGAACLICEMFSCYASRGISLLDRLHELYGIYGYCLNTLHSYAFDGSAGFAKMQAVMQALRAGVASFGGKKVLRLMGLCRRSGRPAQVRCAQIHSGGRLHARGAPLRHRTQAQTLSLRQRRKPGSGRGDRAKDPEKRRGPSSTEQGIPFALPPESLFCRALRRFFLQQGPPSTPFFPLVHFLRYINRISG